MILTSVAPQPDRHHDIAGPEGLGERINREVQRLMPAFRIGAQYGFIGSRTAAP
jgi:hypothetical protein